MKLRQKTAKDGLSGYLLYGLVAMELLMSFSFLGYIHIQPISLTIVYIPVLVAGCLLGPWEAALVGMVFGLASMWKASAFYVSAGDMLFSPVMSGKPVQSILLSVGARTLFGLVAGLLYAAAKRSKYPFVGILLVSSVGRVLHSFIVYGFMQVLFPEAGYHALNAFDNIGNLEFLPFFLIQNLIVLTCYVIQNSQYVKRLGNRIRMADQVRIGIVRSRKTTAIIIALTFAASFSVAWYFINRIEIVLSWHGVFLSDHISYDIVHVQIQFLLGILSLFAIVILVIVLSLKNFNYLYYEAQLDGLTGLTSRGQFFLLSKRILERMKKKQEKRFGYFIIFDIDNFKRINDHYGHPMGDRVLREVAEQLKLELGDYGILGRLGGDEFVVLIYHPLKERELRMILGALQDSIGQIAMENETVTCSIGVVPVREMGTIESLYKSADQLLYEAKKNGKNQIAFES